MKHIQVQETKQNYHLFNQQQSPKQKNRKGNDDHTMESQNDSLNIWMKKMSADTCTSLEEQQQTYKKQQQSPVVSQFDNDLYQRQVNQNTSSHASRNSIQNQPISNSNQSIINHNTIKDNHCLNQYYMQNQPLQTLVAQQSQTETHSFSEEQQKMTPNTQPSISHRVSTESSDDSLTMAPQHTHNCEFKLQSKNCIKSTSQKSQQIMSQKILVSEPKKGLYYKNRTRLVQWLRIQCTRLQLTRLTFANAVFLMDQFYKQSDFNSNEFLEIALTIMVIASKMNQTKILYIGRMAINNGFEEEKMTQRQLEIIIKFNFKIDPYNFARIIEEYINRWDVYVKKKQLDLTLFVGNSLQSFLLYQKLFYICEQQLLIKRQLMMETIRVIFEQLISKQSSDTRSNQQMIDSIFLKENVFAKHENLYVFQCPKTTLEQKEDYNESVRKSLQGWLDQFESQRKPQLIEKFNIFKQKELSHGVYLSYQL